MAKIHEEIIVIKLSKIIREKDDKSQELATDELIGNLEEVIQQLVSSDVIVEAEIVETEKA